MQFKSNLSGLALAATSVVCSVALAQAPAPAASGAIAASAGAMTEGEVRKVDNENRKSTVRSIMERPENGRSMQRRPCNAGKAKGWAA